MATLHWGTTCKDTHSGPSRRLWLAILFMPVVLQPLAGCRSGGSGEKADAIRSEERLHREALESQLRDASAEQASLADAIRTQTQEGEEIGARLAADTQALEELEAARRAFMQEHSVAVAAILAGAASTDVFGDTQTSEEAKQVAVGVGVVVLFWAATHQEELQAVVNALQAAKDRRLSLEQDARQAESSRLAKQSAIDDLKIKEDNARQKAGMLHRALCGSQCGENY